MIDLPRLLRELRIPHASPGEEHYRPGWEHFHCPFCAGSQGCHLGYNLGKDFWNCWRCGGRRWEQVAPVLFRLSWLEVLARYGDGTKRTILQLAKGPRPKRQRREALLPLGCGELQAAHRAYLESRRFDPAQLGPLWDLRGTGLVGPDKLRVLAPVRQGSELVTWQGRDVTGKAVAKYRACPPEKEAVPIKQCLYGLDLADPHRGAAVVEGITDVWRLGPGAVATFGTEWTTDQAQLLLHQPRVFLLFDSGEEAADRFADRFCALLSAAGVPSVEKVFLNSGGDPADLSQDDADHLMRELGLR